MTQRSQAHKTYALDLFYDKDDACALTVLINDVRFHIAVDPKDLQKSPNKPLYYEYLDKISALREAEERDAGEQDAKKPESKEQLTFSDSGVDVTTDDEEDGEDQDQDSGSAGVELRNWILSAFADVIAESAPPDREPEDSTLYEWYHGPTYFYSLQIKNGELVPQLLEENDELNDSISRLVPRLQMPKYIQNIDIPWLNAHDLTVHSEVSFPEPAHPGKITHNETGDVYFFKPADASQPGPFKREVQVLRKIAALDLDIKVPRLLGFVAFENSKTEVMGMLLSHIENPTPLTKLLEASVSETKRVAWSKRSKDYIDILHKHDIIWGDAKADNFIVDKDDELWIIDFGGSYTEGWVDEGLTETVEGDEMGLRKVQEALEKPEGKMGGDGGERETASGLFVTERTPTKRKCENDRGRNVKLRRRSDGGKAEVKDDPEGE